MTEKITNATKITLIRLILVPAFIVISIINFPYHYLTAGLLYVLLATTDSLDGYIARKTNTVTKLGKLLDPIADKAISIAGMVCCLIAEIMFPNNVCIALVVLMIIREVGVSGMRAMVLKKGYVLAADKFGKIKTVFVNVSIPIIYLAVSLEKEFMCPEIAYSIFKYLGAGLFYIAFFFTLFSGARYFYINRKIIKESLSKSEPETENETENQTEDDSETEKISENESDDNGDNR